MQVFIQTSENETTILQQEVDYTDLEIKSRSGNPGYIVGKPIITIQQSDGQVSYTSNYKKSRTKFRLSKELRFFSFLNFIR